MQQLRMWIDPPSPRPSPPGEGETLATFGDAQLDALISEAMTNHPDLRVAANRTRWRD